MTDDGRIIPDKLYTRPEVAKLMHVNVRTISRWIAEGRLASRGPGKKLLSLGADLLKVRSRGEPERAGT